MSLSRQRYQRYLQKLIQQPLQVTVQKVRRRLRTKIKQAWERERARRFSTHLSDKAFAQALDPRFADLDAFLTHMTQRTTPHFFIEDAHRCATVELLRRRAPAQEPLIIMAADQICAHVFDLLGSGPVALGAAIDWHTDFKSGHRWNPQQYFADMRAASYPGGYELKMPWELSRCQHVIWLGQAYWLTSDEKYPQEFVAQITDWIAQNPPQLGVNWGCAMDVAIRAVNWLWGYAFFQAAPALTPAFQLSFFKSLLAHGRHLMTNLEWSETLTSNHYLSDIVGLVYLGILLPELKEAHHWRTFGLCELEKEMAKQVYADGVDFEASVSYHRLALELFLSPTLLAQRNGHQFTPAYLQRLEQMLEFVQWITKPDGAAPLFGDNDNGRLHRLKVWPVAEREWVDYRYLLAVGARLFERTDFAQAAGNEWEEAIWLWGTGIEEIRRQGDKETGRQENTTAWPLQSKILPIPSRAFADAGIYLMRHDDHYLALDAGPNGQKGNGGHAHNDTLSFELYAHGQSWLVDPGAYLYTADFSARNLFRSTAYHNTVCVNDQEQHPFAVDMLFRLDSDSQPMLHAWLTTADYDFLDVSDQSYGRLMPPVAHRRQIYFDKKQGVWIIRDEISSTVPQPTTLNLLWSWHYAAGLTLRQEALGIIALSPQGRAFRLWLLDGAVDACVIEEGWVSPGYGIRTAASIVRYRQTQVTLPQQLTIACLPLPHLSEAEESQRVIAQSNQAFLEVAAMYQ